MLHGLKRARVRIVSARSSLGDPSDEVIDEVCLPIISFSLETLTLPRSAVRVQRCDLSLFRCCAHVQEAKRRRHDDEEITREDRPGVVPHEYAPGLRPRIRAPRARRHVSPHRMRRQPDAQLQQELVGDAFLARCPIRHRGHRPDQMPNGFGHGRRIVCGVRPFVRVHSSRRISSMPQKVGRT